MESVLLMLFGYLAWCGLAFLMARLVKMDSVTRKPVSFLYIILAAPMVVLDIVTGKGTIR